MKKRKSPQKALANNMDTGTLSAVVAFVCAALSGLLAWCGMIFNVTGKECIAATKTEREERIASNNQQYLMVQELAKRVVELERHIL